jgi:DNA-binding transcriptional LysR family regulator
MRRIPNFVLLRAFEAAARLESFTQAGEELHRSQSAISHQVKELEEYFGRPLFYRRNRRVELTAEGRRLFDSLERVFDVLEAACREVSLERGAQVLALHCAPSLAAKWLGPRLPEFTKAHPEITIRLSTGAEPIDLIQVREVDLAISYKTAVNRSGIVVQPMGVERIVPLVSPDALDAAVLPEDLVATMTLIDSQLSRVTWKDWFELNSLEFPDRPRQSFDRAALAISAAVDGMGIALETVRLAERELSSNALVELGAGKFKAIECETHFLSCRASERNLEKIQLFSTWLFSKIG